MLNQVAVIWFAAKLFPAILIGGFLVMPQYPKRKGWMVTAPLLAIGMTVLSGFLWYNMVNHWRLVLGSPGILLNDLFFTVELIVLFCAIYRSSVFPAFIFAVGGWATEHASHQISSMAEMIFFPAPEEWQSFLLDLCCYIVVYCIVGVIFRKKRKLNAPSVNKRMFFPAAILLVVVSVLAVYTPYYIVGEARLLNNAYALACCCITLFLLLGAFEEGRLNQEIHFLNQLDRKRAEQYKMSKESIEAVNTRCHDLKKLVEQIVSDAHAVDLQAVIKELQEYDSIVQTGNAAFDTILTEKNLFCKRNNIKFTVVADATSLKGFSDIDIYSLFGNILDNAIEAVMKLPQEQRLIDLTVRTAGELLCIHAENVFDGTLRYGGKEIVTSKQNETEHGFGLLSIRRIARKYAGEAVVSVEGKTFQLDIVIPVGT